MHTTPSIRLEGDTDRALALVPDAKDLLKSVHRVLANSEANTFGMFRRLSDSAYAYALSANGLDIIYVFHGTDRAIDLIDIPTSSSQGSVRPDFYSGLVHFGEIVDVPQDDRPSIKVCRDFTPTPGCADQQEELGGGRQDVPRLAVEPWGAFSDLRNQSGGDTVFSQYTELHPSMYSGKMASVVQLVMGLGRISKTALYEKGKSRESQTEAVKRYADSIESNGVQVRYDYKFARTHGIYTDGEGALWLVEVGINRGVVARRLPVFPSSDTEQFRAAFEGGENPDRAMLRALDDLGALPTGEAFPADGGAFDALVERGEVIELMSPNVLSEAYQLSPFSTVHGWAFSQEGREAHLAGYTYDDDGYQSGKHYALHIAISGSGGSARLQLESTGRMYGTGTIGRYIPFKAYEPLLPGLLSHDAAPASLENPVPEICDAPVFVAFVDDELHVVRFYRDSRISEPISETTFPDDGCTYSGVYTAREALEGGTIPPTMYTNMEDLRELTFEIVTNVELTSIDLGWCEPYSIFLDNFHSLLQRARKFRQTEVRWTDDTSFPGTMAVAVPKFCRSAYYTFYQKTEVKRGTQTQIYQLQLQDVNSYGGTQNGTLGTLFDPATDPTIVDWLEIGPVPSPSTFLDYAVIYRRQGTPCAFQYADDGSWFNLGDLYSVQLGGESNPPNIQYFTPDVTTDTVKSRFWAEGTFGGINTMLPSSSAYRWFRPSPDPESGDVQRIAATYSVLGESGIIFETDLDGRGSVLQRGYAPASVDTVATCWVGVNIP